MGSAALVLAIGWSVGIATAAVFALPVLFLLPAALASLVAAWLLAAPGPRLLALGLAALLAGQGRVIMQGDPLSPDQFAGFDGAVLVQGRIADVPVARGERIEAVIAVDTLSLLVADAPVAPTTFDGQRPRVLVRLPVLPAAYGDRMEVRGRLARPRSRPGWPLAEMLARRGIGRVLDAPGARVIEAGGVTPTQALVRARAAFEANTQAVLPEPHASLVSGIVFGARATLPPDVRAAMTTTGTSHLTAVSGANAAMVAGALLFLVRRALGPGPSSLVAMAGVWVYTLLVGAPPSAVRAATMATFALAALGFGRQPDTVAALALACAVLLAWDPGLAFDLGFQLSVSATAGLVLLSPSIERGMRWLPPFVRGQLAVALAAQLATLPIIVGTFQRLSLVSLPANVLAAPAIVPIMTAGAALAGLGWLPGLGDVLGLVAWLPTSYLLAIITWAATLPGAELAVGRPPAWLPLIWYAALACWVAAGSADLRALGVRPAWLVSATAGGALVLILPPMVGLPAMGGTPAVEIALLDVEPPAAFVRTPGRSSVLVLTGDAGFGLAPSVWALAAAAETTVGAVIGPDGVRHNVDLLALRSPLGSATVDEGDDAAAHAEIRFDRIAAGTQFEADSGVQIAVLDARLAGDRPVLDLVISAGGVTVLLPGPGQPSAAWATFAGDGAVVGALPTSAISWARLLPAQSWLLLVGEQSAERVRGHLAVPFLARRDHGQVDVSVAAGTVSVRTERCAAGRDCVVVLPRPVSGALVPRP